MFIDFPSHCVAVVLVGIGYVGYDHDLLLPRPFLTFVVCFVESCGFPFNTLAWREMAPDRSSVSASTVLLHPGLVRHSWIAVYIVEDTPPYTPPVCPSPAFASWSTVFSMHLLCLTGMLRLAYIQ